MNCTQANELNPIQVLKQHYGMEPNRIKGDEAWFKARNEKNASLKVDLNNKIWYDFGTGEGGKTIDLVCYLSNIDIPEALEVLQGFESAPIDLSSFEPHKYEKFKLDKVQQLQNPALIQYMKYRRIPYPIATQVRQLKEAYWKYNGKTQFALAWENDKGGYELRNKFYKGGTSPKTITTIEGVSNDLNIFEGFFDYLSALTISKRLPVNTSIVLNSLTNLKKIQNDLDKYNTINLYLDNDKAGNEAAQRVNELYPNTIYRSQEIYPEYGDFNEYLMNVNTNKYRPSCA